MKLVSVAEMVATERAADASGHTYAAMMEHAGRGLADAISDLNLPMDRQSALGLVGPGNNGGDALVALAHLASEHGWKAAAYLMKPRGEDDPLIGRFRQAGGLVFGPDEDRKHPALLQLILEHAVLLDGLLGTGIELPLRGQATSLLRACHEILGDMISPPLIVAVDCPSGVDCDSGQAANETIKADLTVTMAAVKMGLLRMPAMDLTGELRLVGIGLPDGLEPWEAIRREVVSAERVWKLLPDRPIDAHKGTFGTVLVVGGSLNYTGAPLLTGRAAYRAGAGLVTLAVPGPLHAPLAGQFPEATWLLLPHRDGAITAEGVDVIVKNMAKVTALAVGPGMGLASETLKFMRNILAGTTRIDGEVADVRHLPPLVVDADGLKLLAQIDGWPDELDRPAVLTPHPGEMAVLTGLQKDEIQSDRLGIAENYAREWGHVVVLKGAGTVIASPDGRSGVIPVASPALARAGSGDVLTGIIAAFLGQGLTAYEAAIVGAWLHAQAGLKAAEKVRNDVSILAGEILEAIPDVLSSR